MSLLSILRRNPTAVAGPSPDVRLQEAVAASPVGIARVGLNGRWITFNDACTEILGYTRAELSRLRLHDLTNREDAAREVQLIREMLEGRARSYRITKRVADKNGGARVIHLTAIVIRGEQPEADGFLYTIESAEWRAEIDPLSHRAAADILDQLSWTAVLWTNEHGVITGWSGGAERLFGLRRSEAVGRHRWELFRDGDRSVAEEEMAIAAKRGRFNDSGWRRKSDGTLLRVQSSITRLAPDGVTRGYVEEVMADAETLSREMAEASMQQQRLQIRKKVTEVELRAEEFQRQVAALSAALREETEKRKAVEAELETVRAQQVLNAIEFEIPLEVEDVALDATRQGATEIDDAEVSWIEANGYDVTEMINDVSTASRSGVLLLQSDSHRAEIFFEHGRISATTSDDPASLLGEWMVRRGLITEAVRKQALEMCDFAEIAFGRSLVTLNVLTKDQIVAAMRDKIESDIERCQRMQIVRWAFVTSATTRTLVPIGIDPRDLRAMQTVVVLPDGKRYHRSSCSSLAHAESPMHISESAASARGLAPCRRCMVA